MERLLETDGVRQEDGLGRTSFWYFSLFLALLSCNFLMRGLPSLSSSHFAPTPCLFQEGQPQKGGRSA